MTTTNIQPLKTMAEENDSQIPTDSPTGLPASAGSPIPAIESAVLNIGTAITDCESARTSWVYDNWNDCTMWISNAIAQLEAARSKIYAHQETENDQDQP